MTIDEKARLEIILYIAKQLERADFHRVFILCYFADKLHLTKYARPILDDTYKKRQYGPVPVMINEALDHGDYKDSLKVECGKKINTKNIRYIVALRDPNSDYISESEIECLDEVINIHGKKSFQQLTDLSHDSAWESSELFKEIDIFSVIETLDNADDIKNYLQYE